MGSVTEQILTGSSLEAPFPDTGGLLEQARHGDPEAFGELCRAIEPRLFRQAMSLCGNETLAEDLAEDTLVEAWRNLARYNNQCRFFTWLCAILLNRYRNTLRARPVVPLAILDEHDQPDFQQTPNQTNLAPDLAAEASEQAELMRRCMASLPEKHRQVVYLRFFVGESIEEIAAALGCSAGTVKSRLFHGLEKLRRMNALARERKVKT